MIANLRQPLIFFFMAFRENPSSNKSILSKDGFENIEKQKNA
ncbi:MULTISPECIES: hypothetical protein [Neisseria]|nr:MULTISPECIES: hypothetical protein [Neisseria]